MPCANASIVARPFLALPNSKSSGAELLRERVPSLEHLRFCSSGTESVGNVLRVARAFTGRQKIAKFEGAYSRY